MHKVGYKRRIEKFQGKKCQGGVVRSYNPIMKAYSKMLEENNEVLEYCCNYNENTRKT